MLKDAEKQKEKSLRGKGSSRGAVHPSPYLSAMSSRCWHPFACSAARTNTGSEFFFEARRAEKTSTRDVYLVWADAEMLLQRSDVPSRPRAQPLLPSQGRQPSGDAAAELDFFGVCVIQVIQVVSTFNVWQNSYKVKASSCKLEWATCVGSNDSVRWCLAAVIKKHVKIDKKE